MNWEQRWREMVLAGGTVAATACSGGQLVGAGSSDASSGADAWFQDGSSTCCNVNADPCCPSMHCHEPPSAECLAEVACTADGGTWSTFSESCSFVASSGCCNANPDPCCPELHCGAAPTTSCEGERACLADGGEWNPLAYTAADGGVVPVGCSLAEEAGPVDAASDARTNDSSDE